METTTHIIDAKGKSIGRVATEAASVLMGKNVVSFVKNARPDTVVEITNASLLNISEKKGAQKTYTRYSGYPGGLTRETLAALITRRGHAEALRHAIKGMLPSNRLRPGSMKKLIIHD